MYDFVTPQKPLDALRFLKAQNPLYCDIEINQQWLEEAIDNDDELGMCLVEQIDESMDTESDQPRVSQNWPFRTALQFLTFHMMAIVFLVLYHMSYRPAMYAMLTVVN